MRISKTEINKIPKIEMFDYDLKQYSNFFRNIISAKVPFLLIKLHFAFRENTQHLFRRVLMSTNFLNIEYLDSRYLYFFKIFKNKIQMNRLKHRSQYAMKKTLIFISVFGILSISVFTSLWNIEKKLVYVIRIVSWLFCSSILISKQYFKSI